MTTSQYDDILRELKDDHKSKASKYIPKLCYVLRKEDRNMSNHDIVERIKKDLTEIWSRATVIANIPDEFKSESAQERGKQSQKNVIEQLDPMIGSNPSSREEDKKVIQQLTDGSQRTQEPQPKEEPEQAESRPDESVAKVKAQANIVVNKLEEELGDLTKKNQANEESAKMWHETAKRRQKEIDNLRNKQTKQEEKLNGKVEGKAFLELIGDISLELKCSYNPNAQTTQKFCVMFTPESQKTVNQLFTRLR